jgi:DNA (cytosine-5)-methyltransferase 1
MSFPYKWNLKDGYPKKNGFKVFSTFACGGGSSMGYKLAGFDVIGANDIDEEMEKVYKHNHHPKIYIKAPVKDLATIDIPEELMNLDILDGSPPCSTFSMAGAREKNWGKDKMFREGQAKQVLDDLFFDFIKVAKRLQPKIIVAENVKGMLNGNAKGYIIEINKQFKEIGYEVQLFMLNAASMGVPQKRERVFFLCRRKDLKLPPIKINFNEKTILTGAVAKEAKNPIGKPLSEAYAKWWRLMRSNSGSFADVHPKGSFSTL